MELIADAALPSSAGIVDVGGGASGLAGALLRAGYSDVTVADIYVHMCAAKDPG